MSEKQKQFSLNPGHPPFPGLLQFLKSPRPIYELQLCVCVCVCDILNPLIGQTVCCQSASALFPMYMSELAPVYGVFCIYPYFVR